MFQSLLLVLSICLDSFVASIAYGTNKIKIPLPSSIVISLVCSTILGASLFLGGLLKDIIPNNVCIAISFLVLMSLGVYRFFEGLFKAFIQRKRKLDKPLKFKIFDLNFVLQVYAEETKADFDKSKELSMKESVYLAIALSFDSLAVGLASSLSMGNYMEIIILSFIIGISSIILGVNIGKKLIEKTNLNISWLSGIILMLLAIFRIF